MGGERGGVREKGKGREGKGRRGEKGKEGEESASPFPNSWIRPCPSGPVPGQPESRSERAVRFGACVSAVSRRTLYFIRFIVVRVVLRFKSKRGNALFLTLTNYSRGAVSQAL